MHHLVGEGLTGLIDGDSPGVHPSTALVATEMALQLLKGHPEHALQVAHKLVDVTLARHFADDALIVVVSKATAQLLIVHTRFVLPGSPLAGNFFRII